jgi:hypothetical protein
MASKHQMTGMLGVYLTAAELTDKGLIVSVTSRSAKGADLLAVDQSYKETWSVQVKTNRKAAKFWLLSKSYKEDVAKRHIYVFVNLRGKERPDYYVVPSNIVAKDGFTSKSNTGSVWYAYSIDRAKPDKYRDNWAPFGPLISN